MLHKKVYAGNKVLCRNDERVRNVLSIDGEFKHIMLLFS